MTDDKLSHVNEKGEAHMVDISQKAVTDRQASASGVLHVKPATILALKSGETPKGDVLATARIAAIQAVKNTSQLIPMCHPLPVSGATCDLDVSEDQIRATVTVKTTGRTGVEME
ncbi:MAG: cyclic pyranopterin monophosphate synthase MoaC, partial [Pseudomonadota bacterium]